MEKTEIKNPADMFKYDVKTITIVRKTMKEAGLLDADKRFLKYREIATNGADFLAGMTDEQLAEMQAITEAYEEKLYDNAETIQNCVNMAVKDEYKQLFIDNFPFSRDCLFRLFLPRIRGQI